MSGKYVWVEERTQRHSKRRGSRKGIKTTRSAPRWKREVNALWKGVLRSAKTALMLVGLVAVLVLAFRLLGGG